MGKTSDTESTASPPPSSTANAASNDASNLGFDPQALRAKYRAERDKRLRADGIDQYREVKGDFTHYLDDPYAEPEFTREPLTDDVQFVVIGGGFGGLLVSARLREAGVQDIRVIEKAGDFGGTWYWNRYPGASCDVESYIYLPLLEEMGFMPTEKYARASEIFAHCQAIGRKFDLYKNACFRTEVTELRWDEAISRWIISTNRGDRMKAQFVCMANGFHQRPKLPGVPGIESFKGHSFHTSRWDYRYTGGDTSGGLTGLTGKRVGILGTGATAVQCVPHVAAAAEHLYLFQRTPSSVDVRPEGPTDPEWVKSLQPGWQEKRRLNFTALVEGRPQEVDFVKDGWTEIMADLLCRPRQWLDPQATTNILENANFRKMEQIRARVQSIVRDPATAEALKPYYNYMCKRPCFNNAYLETFNRPNVTLVDTAGKGVERVTERGIVANGSEYEIDCLIYATGFENGTSYLRRAGYEVYGKNGLSLTEKWKDGLSTLHGLQTHAFPNCFIISHHQSGNAIVWTHGLTEQAKHLAYIIKECLRKKARTVEVSRDAEAAWVNEILSVAKFAAWRKKFDEECTPGYYNQEGKASWSVGRNGPYALGLLAFTKVLETWRAQGELDGLELTTA